MQVESKEIPLISSSFTYAPKVESLYILEINPTRATEELIRILKPIIKFASLILQENKAIIHRASKNHSNSNSSIMASKVDINLASAVGTVPSTSSYLSSTPPGSNSNYASSLQEANRKRQRLSNNQGDSNSRDTNSNANNACISDKSEDYNEKDSIERTLDVDILEKKTSSENEFYVAPEQALVTSVELVVPAPPPPVKNPELEPKSNDGVRYNNSSSSSCDSTRLLLLPNDKIDGCVNDSSSSLKIRIPTKLALTATDTTGDILMSDRRTSLWTPHQDQSGHALNDTNKPELVNNVSPDLPYQQHHRHSELLLQVEKETTEIGGFSVPSQQLHQHNSLTQEQHYGRPADPNSIIDGQLRNNLYAQMLQQQHLQQQNHQEQIMHRQSPRHQQHHPPSYTNYNAPIFYNAPLFGASQSDHNLRQHQQHPMECHGLLEQSKSLSSHLQHQQHYQHQLQHQNQHQQHIQQQHQQQHQQPQQQPHQQQQHQNHQVQQQHQIQQHQQQHHMHQQQVLMPEQHQQRQLHESYHDLIMEDFHEEPSSAYKLTLSPNNVKSENQDDGYETSAGDVLTPNSHSSSTNSVTPHHQMQHNLSNGIISNNPSQKKSDEQLLLLSKNPINNEPSAPSTATTALGHSHLDQVMATASSSQCSNPTTVVDPFNFMGEEMRSMLSSPAAHHRHIEGITLGPATSYATRSESGSESVPLPVPSDTIFQHPPHHGKNNLDNSINSKPTPKKRGRKKKILTTTECTNEASTTTLVTNQDAIPAAACEDSSVELLHPQKPKERKKHDRFNGMSEVEVIKRTIPDHLCDNLDIVIVGINPGLFAAYKGHHYAGPGNHFWKCLYMAGLTQEQMSADQDHQLLKQSIGFTNMVARATKGSADLTRKEIKEGSRILLEKLQRFRPKIAVFNGKLIFEVFSGKKEFHFGRQPDRVDGTDTYIWVMPSSSARCAQLPRAADKVPFYAALKKFRDFLNGLIPQIDESECVFTDQRIRQCSEQQQSDNKGIQSSQVHQPLPFVKNCGSSIAGDCGGNSDVLDPILSNKLSSSHIISNAQSSDNNNPYTNNSADSQMRHPNESTSYLSVFGHQSLPQSHPQQPLEKKKRGRPKKIKGQQELIIDHLAQQYTHHHHHDFNNILNLSVVETPKKKRGRPKKLKPPGSLDNILVNKQLPNPNNSLPAVVHPLEQHTTTTTTDASPPQSNNHQQLPPSLYNTPPPSHILYTASASPMASPAAGLNCNYTQVHNHGTPTSVAVQEASSNDHLSLPKHSIDQQPHLGETPPPSSPNMCGAVDFEQAENQSQSKVCSTQKVTDMAPHVVEKEEYIDSPSHESQTVQIPVHPNEHHCHQQWLSSPHHHNSLQNPQSKQMSPPQIQHYHHQEQTEHWQRGYEEQNPHPNSYSLISLAHQNQQHLSPRNTNQSLGNFGSDMARKSLCGLESLVDQIPAIREHDEAMSATTQAAAAAVESRLLGLHQQQHQITQKQRCNQDQNSSATLNNNNVINNNNFSVSSLVATKTDTENIYRNNSGEHRGSVESHDNNNTNNEYYHHQRHVVPPHLIETTINSSEPNIQHPLPPHSHPHSSSHTLSSPHLHPSGHPYPSPHSHPMYMELNHLSHIPTLNVNSAVYAPTAYSSQLQHGTGSGSGSGSGDYTTGASHHGHFSPVQVQTSSTPASTTPTLHVPSPNYPFHHHHPYGGHAAPQGSYPSYVHPSHHGHHPPPSPHHHHLSVFDHLKPSDIGGYTGF